MNFQRFAADVMEKWIDDKHMVSVPALGMKRWRALPVADVLSHMEAEWLADAINSASNSEVLGISFEYGCQPDVEVLRVSRDSLLGFNGSNIWKTVIVTDTSESFIYFKYEDNRFFLLCGDDEFLATAYRCTRDTAKVAFLEEWTDSGLFEDTEGGFLSSVWERYDSP